jgi:hypothetical protein
MARPPPGARATELNVPGAWGFQNIARWALGESASVPLGNLNMPPDNQVQVPPFGLWRVSVHVVLQSPTQLDRPVFTLEWGAGHGSQILDNLMVPAVLAIPGFCSMRARLSAPATGPVQVICHVTPENEGRQRIVTLHDATVAPVQLPPTAISVQALAASTITPFGAPAAFALAAGATLPVIEHPTILNTGVVYAEHVL